jgi:hypothetical protein
MEASLHANFVRIIYSEWGVLEGGQAERMCREEFLTAKR